MPPTKYRGAEYEDRLASARRLHASILNHHNSTRLPTLEELAKELTTSPFLAAAACQGARIKHAGYGGVGIEPAEFTHEEDGYMKDLEYDEMVQAVPYMRRLGYEVTLFSDFDDSCPFSLNFVGDQFPPIHETEARLKAYARGEYSRFLIHLHGTSPAQIRRRGLLKCVPRLLGWLRAARIALADPRRPGAMEALIQENEAGMASADPPHWANKPDVQQQRKRALVDAMHASEEDVAKGARWVGVHVKGRKLPKGRNRPMRIEAVAGDHFVFQAPREECFTTYTVEVLHRDAFEVEPFHCAGHEAGHEAHVLKGIEYLFETRYEGISRENPGEESDSSDS